jgi:cell division protein FtsN
MTRDYAKRNTKRTRTPAKKKSSHWRLWFFTLFIFTAFTFGLVFVGKHQRQLQHAMKATPKASKVKVVKATPVQPAAEPVKATTPKFDFYTMLPQKNSNAKIPEYELEVATLKDYASADHLKAELALLGFTVNITPVREAGSQKYRVTVGPYDNKDGATAEQLRLKQNKISSTLRKIK